jgi:hypothetical protein
MGGLEAPANTYAARSSAANFVFITMWFALVPSQNAPRYTLYACFLQLFSYDLITSVVDFLKSPQALRVGFWGVVEILFLE